MGDTKWKDAPSRAKLMPSTGSGSSGGTSSTGRSTLQGRAQSTQGGAAARELPVHRTGQQAWKTPDATLHAAGSVLQRHQRVVPSAHGPSAPPVAVWVAVQAQVLALGVADIVKFPRVCRRHGRSSCVSGAQHRAENRPRQGSRTGGTCGSAQQRAAAPSISASSRPDRRIL